MSKGLTRRAAYNDRYLPVALVMEVETGFLSPSDTSIIIISAFALAGLLIYKDFFA